MLLINEKGIKGWDFEALAGGVGESRWETRWICGVLVVWWILLLITVSGLKNHTWFLIGVGGIGMFQNVYLAGAKRTAGAFNIHLTPHTDGPIIGRRQKKPKNVGLDELKTPEGKFEPLVKVGNVMGALMEVEQRFPKVGASLITVFFPGSLAYEPGRFKFQWEKDFWKPNIVGSTGGGAQS